MIEFGSCPQTVHSGARRRALVTRDPSAPERAPVRGHPLCFTFHEYAPLLAGIVLVLQVLAAGSARTPAQDDTQLAALYQAATAGDAQAEFDLGVKYATGKGVPYDGSQ